MVSTASTHVFTPSGGVTGCVRVGHSETQGIKMSSINCPQNSIDQTASRYQALCSCNVKFKNEANVSLLPGNTQPSVERGHLCEQRLQHGVCHKATHTWSRGRPGPGLCPTTWLYQVPFALCFTLVPWFGTMGVDTCWEQGPSGHPFLGHL